MKWGSNQGIGIVARLSTILLNLTSFLASSLLLISLTSLTISLSLPSIDGEGGFIQMGESVVRDQPYPKIAEGKISRYRPGRRITVVERPSTTYSMLVVSLRLSALFQFLFPRFSIYYANNGRGTKKPLPKTFVLVFLFLLFFLFFFAVNFMSIRGSPKTSPQKR